ncbi:MAG TPA: hypothetical protein VK539_05380 [Myxococcaceae bacterium]|nr:hypothetical protein [Myxococcaceae bacterium]
MPVNVGRSPVRSNATPSTTAVERKAPPRVETPQINASVRGSVDDFVPGQAQGGPVINPAAIPPPGTAGGVGSTQEAQEALRGLSAALEPFRQQLDELAGKIPPDLKNNEGALRQFLKEGLERLGIDPRDFPDAIDHIQKVHSTNRDRLTS